MIILSPNRAGDGNGNTVGSGACRYVAHNGNGTGGKNYSMWEWNDDSDHMYGDGSGAGNGDGGHGEEPMEFEHIAMNMALTIEWVRR